MKIFDFLIPKDKAQTVQVIKSYSVIWYVRSGWSNDTIRYAKTLVDYKQALEFKKQLEESAKFIGAWLEAKIEEH